MTTIYFTNHQKRQLVEILKKYPCITYVKKCFESEKRLEKFAVE